MAERSSPLHSQTYDHIRTFALDSRRLDAAAKRAFDILVSALGLLLLSPLFLFLAWRIKRDSPGPVFYRGPRYGLGGRIFHILKFRTMYEHPQSYAGPRLTAQDDPRVTPLGKWLRDTKLNELPQLWNVLVGEMSLVGPRPEDPELGKSWPLDVRQEILSVRPGITSPASVQFRNEEGMLQGEHVMHEYMDYIMPTKLRLDQLYVRNRSFWLDLDTLFWTFMVLLPKLGEQAPPEELLFLGPVTRLVRRYLSWFVIDTLVSFAAMGLIGLLWRAFSPLDVGLLKAALTTLGFAVLFSLTGALLGTHRIVWSRAHVEDVYDLLPPAFLATALVLVLNHYLAPVHSGIPQPVLPPALVLMGSLLSLTGFVVVRYRRRILRSLAYRWLNRSDLSAAQERVLIVGGGESGQFAAWLLSQRHKQRALSIVGFVDDDLYKQGVRFSGVDVLGRTTDIPRLVEQHDIGVLIFAIHNIAENERHEILTICQSTPARLVMVPDILSGFNAILQGDDAPAARQELQTGHSPQPAIPSTQVDAWLTGLEEAARNGDLPRLQTEIQSLRSRLPTSPPRSP